MNKYAWIQVAGMVAVAIGAQGTIRLLLDHRHGGALSWVPGGFPAWLIGHLVLVALGVGITSWADTRRKSEAG